MVSFIVHYAEIGLKGKNRLDFEKQLVRNIRFKLNLESHRITRQRGQLIVTVDQGRIDAFAALSQIFGVAWFAQTQLCPSEVKSIVALSLQLARQKISRNQTFAVSAKRSAKSHRFTSQDLEQLIGEKIRLLTGAQVNLNQPDVCLNILVREKLTYLFFDKLSGPGGLPVGASGRVISLISGGFDSILSSYLLAKRGASVAFLHFHALADPRHVTQSKIFTICQKLAGFTLSTNLHLASYLPFQLAALGLNPRLQKSELVVFRRLMVKVAASLARQLHAQAIILGDSLGQVASQTLENIAAVDQAVDLPVFRPLIGFDKQEIINQVKKLHLETIAAEPYKDCCSLIATHPATKANISKINQLETQISIDRLVQQITRSIVKFSVAP